MTRKTLVFVMPKELEEKLNEIVKGTGNSKSSFIRSAIWEKIKNEQTISI